MEALLDHAELYFLLNVAGVDAPIGVDTAHFPIPDDSERAKVLQAGQSQLMSREEEQRRVMVETVAHPALVLHVTRVEQGSADEHLWFFYTPSQTVRLQKLETGQYRLATIFGESAVLDEIEQLLPLQPVPEEMIYRVRLPYDDFLTLRDLASEWEEVPALEILEAEGLDEVTSRDLFDSAVEPEWRAIIDCLTCQKQAVTKQTTLRVLQGAEISWIIRPAHGDKLLVETAQPGLFNEALADMWDSCLAG